jgi:aryl-phospho-beta-D-glucosidase BglC (GH1 family)
VYFADRRSKGFNVIQINVLIYLWAARGWNGGLPAFQDNNTDLRNEAFWARMDWIVDRAKAYGLHMALSRSAGDTIT